VSVTATDAVGASGSPASFTWTIAGVTVPDVRSESRLDAIHLLTQLGLVASVSTRKSCIDPGAVLTQSPAGGVVVAPGSTVSITVDSGTPSTCNLQ
jgi:beta-lactam-binding protein with PASTA domain